MSFGIARMTETERSFPMPIFVILHYLSAEMTEECVDTLRKTFHEEKIHIIIVDNGSGNGSGPLLQARYEKEENCTVLLSSRNLGFAQGNNLGYRYALEHFDPEYVIVMNNDVLIEDTQFLNKVRNIQEETNFFVLGPDIFACKAGVHQNPMSAEGYSPSQIANIIRTRKRWLTFYSLHFTWDKVQKCIKQFLKKLLRKESTPAAQRNPLSKAARLTNPVLHGACYIFSPAFLQAMPEPFHPGTFLYFEEDILHYICIQKGYTMIYDSSISVKHMEDVSTNVAFRSEYKKRKMKYQNLIHSATILQNLMAEGAFSDHSDV